MKNKFTIGEFAKLYGINYRTLRYYDEVGLLRPESVDKRNGYRYYTTKQFEVLNMILYLRELDISIPVIKQFLDNRDVERMEEMLLEQKAEIHRRKRKLDRIEHRINNRLKHLDGAKESGLEIIQEVSFPKRKAVILKKELHKGDDVEYPLREAVSAEASRNMVIFLGKVGFRISEELLRQEQLDTFSSIFVLLEKEDEYDGAVSYIMPGDYLTIRFCGSHTQSQPYYSRLLRYMEQTGRQLAGDALEITLIDYGLTNDASEYVTELQIPVKAADISKKT